MFGFAEEDYNLTAAGKQQALVLANLHRKLIFFIAMLISSKTIFNC